MGATGMVVDTTKSTIVDDSAYTDPVACLAVSSMGQELVYANSRWRAVRLQSLHEPGEDFEHLAHQAVVEFPDAGAAAAFFTASIPSWRACASGRYTYRPGADQPVADWRTGPVDDHAGMLTASITQQDGDGWGCRRALTAAANVVADVLACSFTDRDDAATVARNIASRVLGQ
ncbi:lipoprotein LppH [Mycolicibacterium rhodesiae JS60]|nr:lipoprotein LppH [Mycolicibacterium rhodesiae JS60]